MDRRSWLLLYALGATWGASYMLIAIGLEDLSPVWIAWGRTVLAALVVVPIALAQGALRGLGGRWPMLWVLAFVQLVIPFLLISWGQLEVPTALTGILIASAPLYTALLAIWVDHEERVQGVRLFGLLIGIVGVMALLGLDLTGSTAALMGGIAILVASFAYAGGGLILKHNLPGISPLGAVAAILILAAVMLTPFAAITAPDTVPSAGSIAAVATLGLFGTGVAFVVFFGLIRAVGPGRALIVSYLAPGFAVVYGAWLRDEPITLGTILGLALILAGSWLAVEGGLRRASRQRKSEDIAVAIGGIAPGDAAATAAALAEPTERR